MYMKPNSWYFYSLSMPRKHSWDIGVSPLCAEKHFLLCFAHPLLPQSILSTWASCTTEHPHCKHKAGMGEAE